MLDGGYAKLQHLLVEWWPVSKLHVQKHPPILLPECVAGHSLRPTLFWANTDTGVWWSPWWPLLICSLLHLPKRSGTWRRLCQSTATELFAAMRCQNCSLMPSPSVCLEARPNCVCWLSQRTRDLQWLVWFFNVCATMTTHLLLWWTLVNFSKASYNSTYDVQLHATMLMTRFRISVNSILLKQSWLKMNGGQVWQPCHAYDWFQCPSYTHIRETKMRSLQQKHVRNDMFECLAWPSIMNTYVMANACAHSELVHLKRK